MSTNVNGYVRIFFPFVVPQALKKPRMVIHDSIRTMGEKEHYILYYISTSVRQL